MTAVYNRDAPQNAKPHVLHVKVVQKGWGGGIEFSLDCPYEGVRDCGVVDECYGSPKESEKWGCTPYPQAPNATPVSNGSGGYEYSDEDNQAWEAFEKAREAWQDEHVWAGSYYGHRTDECWYVHMTTHGAMEHEEFLADFPDGMEIVSPMEVIVGTEGSGEETVPAVKLWKES